MLVSCHDMSFPGCIRVISCNFIHFSLSITGDVVAVSISRHLVKDFAIFDFVVHFFCIFSEKYRDIKNHDVKLRLYSSDLHYLYMKLNNLRAPKNEAKHVDAPW